MKYLIIIVVLVLVLSVSLMERPVKQETCNIEQGKAKADMLTECNKSVLKVNK